MIFFFCEPFQESKSQVIRKELWKIHLQKLVFVFSGYHFKWNVFSKKIVSSDDYKLAVSRLVLVHSKLPTKALKNTWSLHLKYYVTTSFFNSETSTSKGGDQSLSLIHYCEQWNYNVFLNFGQNATVCFIYATNSFLWLWGGWGNKAVIFRRFCWAK